MTEKPFKLKSQRESKAKLPDVKESIQEAQTFRYLFSLRNKGVLSWKNDEHPHPRGYSSSNYRRLGSDIFVVIRIQGGRLCVIEMKTETEYRYIMKHYDELKKYFGPNQKKTHYRIQIEFVEDVVTHGGLGFFAWNWMQVKERFEQEGIV